MPISTSFQSVPDLPTRVVQPGDVSINDGGSISIPLNRNGDIRERAAAIKQIQFNVRGLTGNEVAILDNVAQTNLINDLNGINPRFRDIRISGLTYLNCFLTSVQPSGSLSVGAQEVVDSTTIVYETSDRYIA